MTVSGLENYQHMIISIVPTPTTLLVAADLPNMDTLLKWSDKEAKKESYCDHVWITLHMHCYNCGISWHLLAFVNVSFNMTVCICGNPG